MNTEHEHEQHEHSARPISQLVRMCFVFRSSLCQAIRRAARVKGGSLQVGAVARLASRAPPGVSQLFPARTGRPSAAVAVRRRRAPRQSMTILYRGSESTQYLSRRRQANPRSKWSIACLLDSRFKAKGGSTVWPISVSIGNYNSARLTSELHGCLVCQFTVLPRLRGL